MKSVMKLELEEARAMVEAAKKAAEEVKALESICIVDDGGYVIAMERMNGGRITGPEIAIAKAFTASGHKRSTHLFNQPGGRQRQLVKRSAFMSCFQASSQFSLGDSQSLSMER